MKYFLSLTAASLFISAPVPSFAQEADLGTAPEVLQLDPAARAPSRNSQRLSVASGGLLFASFDQDGDYEITQDEVRGGIAQAFDRAETSGNGSLSLVEVDRWRERALGSLDLLPGNTQFDRNFDAVVTRAEFTEVLSRNAARLDADEDGVLVFSELLQKAPEPQKAKRERDRIFPSRADRQRRR